MHRAIDEYRFILTQCAASSFSRAGTYTGMRDPPSTGAIVQAARYK